MIGYCRYMLSVCIGSRAALIRNAALSMLSEAPSGLTSSVKVPRFGRRCCRDAREQAFVAGLSSAR